MTLEFRCRTVVGHRRDENQDTVRCESLAEDAALVLVADGMGGHAGGATASETAGEAFTDHVLTSDWESDPTGVVEAAVESAHGAVREKAVESPEKADMGCTLVGGVVTPNTAVLANVGDSRAYEITTEATQLTTDQTLANELVQDGELDPEAADDHQLSSVLEQSVGGSEEIDPEIVDTEYDGVLLLCSDGLTDELSDDQLLLGRQNGSLTDACEELVTAANAAGGRDNISVILVRDE
ncbi:serine/threonine-protein phosphatase [Halobaculum sp. WSA2]|uniref:Serine/threonine-protein phosphatase n=1 Tax=Halobaculum saliterrae TaxID=2073113 RepID=A0A6B0T2G3_9EURY|nr:protein phosphatase 2C domain-containing protein [Halobaculum saliterrae]MXR40719.1 serine/threonine-protein phosphatase [Halobaculum saliterrae]